jgi:hypothetical protein
MAYECYGARWDSNTQGSAHTIADRSRLVVPEGCGLLTVRDGALTALVAEPGGYTFASTDPNAWRLHGRAGLRFVDMA